MISFSRDGRQDDFGVLKLVHPSYVNSLNLILSCAFKISKYIYFCMLAALKFVGYCQHVL